jgi:hypothetical protein
MYITTDYMYITTDYMYITTDYMYITTDYKRNKMQDGNLMQLNYLIELKGENSTIQYYAK